ncbi:MAG: hypothetical protein CMF50_09375 [Legionellales bacterium]|nr:hypothetical protein [Legionellales bacterium]|tara:strand:- start:30998 stop:31597 length:600 start_codon:yes stop_codon:yes gene_type:complete
MLEAYIRPTFDRIIANPINRQLAKRWSVEPIHLTILAVVLGMVASFCIAVGWRWGAVGLLLASGLCDVLDGHLSRELGTDSPMGSLLDIMGDRLVEFIIVLGFYAYAPAVRSLLCLLMLGSILLCITSFLVVGIYSVNNGEKSFHYSSGLMERAEAFIFFIAMIVWPQYFTILATLFVILVLLTAAHRVWQFGVKVNKL